MQTVTDFILGGSKITEEDDGNHEIKRFLLLGGKVGTVADFILGGSKIAADGDCSHEIKRHLLLARKVMTKSRQHIRNRDITLPTKVHLVRRWFFQ